MADEALEELPTPTLPALSAKVREFRGFCAQRLVDVVLQLPTAVCDTFFDVLVVPDQLGDKDALLVHLPLSGLVWKVALPFPVNLEAPGTPSIGKLRRRRRTLTIQGLKAGKTRWKPLWSCPLLVRSLSGQVVHSLDAADDSVQVTDIVRSICESTKARSDEVQLMLGADVLEHDRSLGQCIGLVPEQEAKLELSLAVVQGPPVTALATSGEWIKVLDGVPNKGVDRGPWAFIPNEGVDRGRCHFDRDYVFTSLGDFAGRPSMRYVMTCNEDRKTPAEQVMWQLDIRVPATVYLNFRSQGHVQNTGVLTWLARDGWEHKPDFESTVSTGYPNGPYSGPVYAKAICPENRKHVVKLMGSNCWEGTYFVFVELDREYS